MLSFSCQKIKPADPVRAVDPVRKADPVWFNIVGPTGLCVAANSGNGRITQQKCGNDSLLLWKKELKGNKFLIINKNGKTLDNDGNRNINGNPIYSRTKHGKGNQLWSLNRISDGKYLIKESSFNKCLDDTGFFAGRKAVNRNYHLWSCSSHNKNQWFEFKNVSDTPTLNIGGPVKPKHAFKPANPIAKLPAINRPYIYYYHNYFVGHWNAVGYTCNKNTPKIQKIKITAGAQIEGFKLTGDECIPSGSKTFQFKITASKLWRGQVIGKCLFYIGAPGFKTPKSEGANVQIIDLNSFTIGNHTYYRIMGPQFRPDGVYINNLPTVGGIYPGPVKLNPKHNMRSPVRRFVIIEEEITDPCEPVDPVKSVDPFKPVDPVKPVDAFKPKQVSKPVDAIKPKQASKPKHAVRSSDHFKEEDGFEHDETHNKDSSKLTNQ